MFTYIICMITFYFKIICDFFFIKFFNFFVCGAQQKKQEECSMTKCEKRFLAFSMVMGGGLFVPQSAYAMHIMEGYLPPAYCAAWGAL